MALLFDSIPGVSPGNQEYPDGFIQNAVTPVSAQINQDMIQFFQKLRRDAVITPNGDPDREEPDAPQPGQFYEFQFVEALIEKIRATAPVLGGEFVANDNATAILQANTPVFGISQNSPVTPAANAWGYSKDIVNPGLARLNIVLGTELNAAYPFLNFQITPRYIPIGSTPLNPPAVPRFTLLKSFTNGYTITIRYDAAFPTTYRYNFCFTAFGIKTNSTPLPPPS